MDFTYKIYRELIESLIDNQYVFQTYKDYIKSNIKRSVVLRHDVDKKPLRSLRFAKIQSEYNINGSYYFRAVNESWDEDVIREIHSLGHEIGFHYESLTTCKGDFNDAIIDFKNNLKKLRDIVPVETMCMHGSPTSKFDSRDLWNTYKYRDYGIIGEPYFDLNFDETFYLTDTGRMWDGYKYSVRDKITTHQEKWNQSNLAFHRTYEIIESLNLNSLPESIMFVMHPQRWTDKKSEWLSELISQSIKNKIKKLFFVHEK